MIREYIDTCIYSVSYAELSFVPHLQTLRGAMFTILDICWNVTSQHKFWIQIILKYNEYLFTSKGNIIPQWNYKQIEVDWMHYISGRLTFQMSEQVSTMLYFELLQSSY